jgi:hypothetical protein
MRPLSVLLSLLLLSMPVLSSTGPDGSEDDASAENDWTVTLLVVGAIGLGLALLAILGPEEATEEVVVSEGGEEETAVDEEALETIEASRAAEEEEVVEDELFREIEEGD